MRRLTWYRALFVFLRGLIYVKRLLVWCLQKFWRAVLFLQRFFRESLGFYLYKLGFKLKNKIGQENFSGRGSVWGLLGGRRMLQIFFFLVLVLLMYPHSHLYGFAATHIPGRNTTLFHLLGPGEQDFSLDEINVDNYLPAPAANSAWREGAVTPQANLGVTPNSSLFENISLTLGGSAVAKPNILPGAIWPQLSGGGTGRIGIIIHEVETGETIGALAEKYQISVSTILWANNLTVRSYIRPGDKLKILPVSGLAHKIKKGDTLAKIAKLYNTTADKIIEFNKLKADGSDLVVGEEILVPNGVKPAPVVVAPVYRPPSGAIPSASSGLPSTSGYLWPTAVRRITQYFGWRHTGVDIAGPVGTPVYATRAGTIIKSQCGWNGGYGCYTIIDHGNGLTSLYGHSSRLLVDVGEEVTQGQTIMLMGSTGRSTGSHLHFEIRRNGARANPLSYIR